MPEQLTMTVSLSRKINLGNYESADVFVSVSGITEDTTEAEVEAVLSNRIAWDALKRDIQKKSQEIAR